MEALKSLTKTDILHVPYKGAPESVTAMMGGHIDYVIATAGVAAPAVKSGKAKALAVTSDTRHPVFPEAPTLAESFSSGLVLEPWSVLSAPAHTPAAVVNKLNQAINQVLKDPRTIDYYNKLGGEILLKTSQESDAFYREEARRLARARGALAGRAMGRCGPGLGLGDQLPVAP